MNFLERAIRARDGIRVSDEFRRIVGLPRREPDLSLDVTEWFRKAPGPTHLWPIQSLALVELSEIGGLVGAIQAGGGKSLIAILGGEAVQAERPVIVTLPKLKDQYVHRDLPRYRKEFRFPEPKVITYHDLSHGEDDLLESLNPDYLVLDEAQALRHLTRRTRKVRRFVLGHEDTFVVVLSGTLWADSMKHAAHLVRWAIGGYSPFPAHRGTLEEWSAALDVKSLVRPKPGVLYGLCPHDHGEGLDGARKAFRCRFISTPGIVATEENAVGVPLLLSAWKPEVPASVEAALKELRETWTIQGEEIADPLSYARVIEQVSFGFFYRWLWPNGEKDWEWLDIRSRFSKAVRSHMRTYDSPGEVLDAAKKGEIDLPEWAEWQRVEGRKFPVETVWIDRFAVEEALKWSRDGGIVWYGHRAMGAALREKLPEMPSAGKAVCASFRKYGTGIDGLQERYSRSLYLCSLNGAQWEQTLARTHREGQQAELVEAFVPVHGKELLRSWQKALEDASYSESIKGQRQRILLAAKENL